ncbi:AMP-binding protein [Halopseudomonas pachastrellae]|nr:AMP-binding protein [Halopseudomonas pachastrellae]
MDASGLPRFVDALAVGARLALTDYRANPVALYQYTGGTTGRSKGAVLTHANLLAVLQMAEDYITGFGMPFEPGDVILTVPPLYHIFAFNFNFLLLYRSGGRNLLVPNPRPLSNLQRAFEQFPVRWMTGVDTLFAGLLAALVAGQSAAAQGCRIRRHRVAPRHRRALARAGRSDTGGLRADREQLFCCLQSPG